MSTKKKTAIYYWDSSVFLALLMQEDGRAENVEHFLEEAESQDAIIVTSSFTLVEVIKLKKRQPILPEKQAIVTGFFQRDYFRFIDATRKITEDARGLIWTTPGLMPKDAVHLASAVEFVKQGGKLDAVHSYDTDFTNLNGKLPVSCPIEEPIPMAPTLGLKVARKHPTKKSSKSSSNGGGR
jgi:predicted nucleic acid-binding protein